MLQSFDPEIGAHQWTFYSTPPPGTPGFAERRRHRRADVDDRHLRSRSQSDVRRHRQSDAGAERRRRVPATTPGPAASSRSIPTPASSRGDFRRRRTTRTTGMPPRCRSSSTATFNGAPRKLLMQASRNGYFFVLDRTTGKNLLTTPFAAVNWAKGIDEDGRPIPDPAKEPSRDGVLDRAERKRRDQLSLAELRSAKTGSADRQRAGCLRHLLLQAGARRLRLGGRGLQPLRPDRCCARSTIRPERSAGTTTSATARRARAC